MNLPKYKVLPTGILMTWDGRDHKFNLPKGADKFHHEMALFGLRCKLGNVANAALNGHDEPLDPLLACKNWYATIA